MMSLKVQFLKTILNVQELKIDRKEHGGERFHFFPQKIWTN